MGWSSGSELFGKVIEAIKPAVPDEEARVAIYTKLIPEFENQDWDTQDECLDMDPAYDRALTKLLKLQRP
jgi:hypothetical protein